ncbi:dimethylaniline monooxygenase [Emericellopsis atlantica]|uniref:Dimethylaniline monooxygenase n=1 Tax=Emericellopsis atlantica TaxID=2614577 RepID=A0A9P7ZU87_9HYPO|nr:dimethylaniline monooxygenase [Emericellopsis atlantica]KAG9258454.1 dimethylaniline monooxygenase [Emericellopsis atlantica]
MSPRPIKRVAVVGAGPSGAIAIDALAREQAFDIIRVFERREAAGGCWIGDHGRPPPTETDLATLGDRTADKPIQIPSHLPAFAPRTQQDRYTESSIYPYLETNVDELTMRFTEEPFPDEKSERSIDLYGPDTPFRHWKVVRDYVQSLVQRRGYEDYVSYNTTVERAEKIGHEWKVTLRKGGQERDYFWVEWFDAVVVASGHYAVPYIPTIPGLEDTERSRPGTVVHSKHFRGRDMYENKRVVIVGVSVSAADIAFDLTTVAKSPVHAVVIGHTANAYFGDVAFDHPRIQRHHSITRVDGKTVYFSDDTSITDVDHIIFGTGYTWTLPFLPQVPIRKNRVPDLYQHVVWRHDPTLLFVGAVNAGLTFKIFEWQAVYAARLLSGRGKLPPVSEQAKWEEDRIKARGDGPKFAVIHPDFEAYFNQLRELAGDGDGVGRKLPPFDRRWFRQFMETHESRKRMWRRIIAAERRELEESKASSNTKARL